MNRAHARSLENYRHGHISSEYELTMCALKAIFKLIAINIFLPSQRRRNFVRFFFLMTIL